MTSTRRENSIGGVVLCGGHSRRMGRPKATLPFGPEVMLQRVARILSEAVGPVVVVSARGQSVPDLSDNVQVVTDEYESHGPLAGIATGLGALRNEVEFAFVTSCDVPLLKPAFVTEMVRRLGNCDVAVPNDGQYDHVLSGVYRTKLEDQARQLLAADRRRPVFLLDDSSSLRVPVEELRAVDPQLDSLKNTNTPEEYAEALKAAGFNVQPYSPDDA